MWALERLGGLEPTHDRAAGARRRSRRARARDEAAGRAAVGRRRRWCATALADADPFVRRAAADALARHPHGEHVQPLAERCGPRHAADDTHLIHVARMALRDQLLAPGVYAARASRGGRRSRQPGERLAERQPGRAERRLGAVRLAALATPTPSCRGARRVPAPCCPLLCRRRICRERLCLGARACQDSEPERAGRRRARAGRGTQERGASCLPDVGRLGRTAGRRIAGRGQRRTGASRHRPGPRLQACGVRGAGQAAGPDAPLRRPAHRGDRRLRGQRSGAGRAAVGRRSATRGEPCNLRQHAAAGPGANQRRCARGRNCSRACKPRPNGWPWRSPPALADSPPGAEGLLAAIDRRQGQRRGCCKKTTSSTGCAAASLDDFDERLAKLTASLPPADERIKELIASGRNWSPDGQADVAPRAPRCSKSTAPACHRIGDKGAKIGPNLDGVGIRGVDRLLEDILDPSRNVDQAFRTTQIVTADGRILTGLALREEGEDPGAGRRPRQRSPRAEGRNRTSASRASCR